MAAGTMNETQIHERLKESGLSGVGELDTGGVDPFVVVDGDSIVAGPYQTIRDLREGTTVRATNRADSTETTP